MKVRLIQAVVVGVFVMVGIVVSQIDEIVGEIDSLMCEELLIKGEDVHIHIASGHIEFINAKTKEVAGFVSFYDNEDIANGVLVSCNMVEVTDATDHIKDTFDNALIIQDDSVTIREGGKTRTRMTADLLSLNGKRSKVFATLMAIESSGVLLLGNQSGDSKLFHSVFEDKSIKEGEY